MLHPGVKVLSSRLQGGLIRRGMISIIVTLSAIIGWLSLPGLMAFR
jgi:hypothetical protein